MRPSQEHLRHVAALLSSLFGEFGDHSCDWQARTGESSEFVLKTTNRQQFSLCVWVRERITPQMAEDLFARMSEEPVKPNVIRLVYAPVISPRVADLARRHGIAHLDHAGNCHIVLPSAGLLISRSGVPKDSTVREKATAVDLFAPKSSRILRAMLHEPSRGWQVTELASHSDVQVSPGLVSKVKQTLLTESYARVSDRLLYLKDPGGLLKAWSQSYPGAISQREYYVRGETQEIESLVARWCEAEQIEYALARFSAAWRLAPEVRYSTAAVYVSQQGLRPQCLESLRSSTGAREVESGANLVLLTPFDDSVFSKSCTTDDSQERTTSALQTWLDLMQLSGRGTEAAAAIYSKHILASFETIAPAVGAK